MFVPTVSTEKAVLYPLTRGVLTDNGATPWYAEIGLGTPAQPLKYMMDTGTENSWVTASQCTTDACNLHGKFDAAASSTFTEITGVAKTAAIGPRKYSADRFGRYVQPIVKNLGPWGSMLVYVGEDDFAAEESTQRMKFQRAIHYSGGQFAGLACDGGIAIPSPYVTLDDNTQSLMIQLYESGKIGYPSAAFSMPLDGSEGQCLFGAMDDSRYQADTLQWLEIIDVSDTGEGCFWPVELKSMKFDGQEAKADITSLVFDTGSSYFKGPACVINALVKAATRGNTLPAYVSKEEELAAYPTITLEIGNQTYTLTPDQYFLQYNPEYWEIGIQVLDGMPEGMLLVGSMFLEHVYSVYDFKQKKVGLALPQ